MSLIVTFRGKPLAVKTVVQKPRSDGKRVTLVYTAALNLRIETPSELRVELYDPTYYADMGIRAKAGAFFRGVKNEAAYEGAYTFEQDFARPYYGGAVFPEAVVFALRP